MQTELVLMFKEVLLICFCLQYGMKKTFLQIGVEASSFQYQRKDASATVTTGEG